MTKNEYLNKLTLLEKWSDAYYNGEALVDDNVFDTTLKDVREYERLNNVSSDIVNKQIGSPVLKNKDNHRVKMYSMMDLFNLDAVDDFIKDLPADTYYHISPKYDGVSLSLVYNNGNFTKAITRGDGMVGERIVDANATINNIPDTISYTGYIEIRGEVLIGRKDLERINNENDKSNRPIYSNRRNAVSGLLRHLDRKYVRSTNLIFIPYDIGHIDNVVFNMHSDKINFLNKQGFKRARHLDDRLKHLITMNLKEIQEYYTNIINIRDSLDIQLDGVVIRVNDLKICQELGHTSKYPLYMVAYKFPALEISTRLLDVVYDVGKSGVITPVGIIEPIDIDGVTVKQCTLHNYNFIKDMDLHINSKVWIVRSGDVIPKLVKVSNNKEYGKLQNIIPPTNCPSCGTEVAFDGTYYKCINPDCQGSITKKLINFVSRTGLNIVGLGSELIEDLVNKGLILNFRSIFDLTKDDLFTIEGVGELKANNILKAIEESKKVNLDKFIYSLGIPGVGSATATTIANLLKDDWYRASEEDFSKIDGIGDILSKKIFAYIEDNYEQIEDLIEILNIIYPDNKDGKLSGKKLAITGSLDLPRHQYEDRIKKEGGILTNTINKDLSYLIVGDNPSSKLDKAKKLGIPIISLEEFKTMV